MANDNDLRIVSKLTNILFLTVSKSLDKKIEFLTDSIIKIKNSADIQWAQPSVSGDPNYPTYNGKQVILSSSTLQNFATYMNGKSFPFTYDRAVGMFSKDLWSADTTQTPARRSQVVGFANLPGLCNSGRYAINEEYGGFQMVNQK